MKKKDFNGYIESMVNNNSKNLEIRKSIYNKEIEIMIPHNHKVKRISREQEFIIKLIFYLEYISINNLKTILSPVMNSLKVDYIVSELTDAKLLKCRKKGFYGSFYYLSKYCIELITEEKSEGKYAITDISNTTLESQDYRHLYLAEMVIQRVLSRLNTVYNNLTKEERKGYITGLFIKNVSFDLMMKRADRSAYLKSIGYLDNEIKMVDSLKSYYSEKERNRYKDKVINSKAEILGYSDYFESYKKMFIETQDTFSKYILLYDLIRIDTEFDYFDCIKKAVFFEVKDGTTKNIVYGKKHNLIRYQTSDVRQVINVYAQLVATENGKKGKIPEVIRIDKEITELVDEIQFRNAICINLRKNLDTREISEAEAPYYRELMNYINEQEEKKKDAQENYNKKKLQATFIDSKAKIHEEDRPLITIKALELRNVFIGNVEKKVSKNGVSYLDITVVNIDRTKDLKNFKSSGLRRDYFGVCEKLKSIGDELGITVVINYIYCYPKGSNIVGYEKRFNKIFENGTSNTSMKGADKFVIKELKSFVPLNEYMERVNKLIIS